MFLSLQIATQPKNQNSVPLLSKLNRKFTLELQQIRKNQKGSNIVQKQNKI